MFYDFFRQLVTRFRKEATRVRKVEGMGFGEIAEFRNGISLFQTRKITMTATTHPLSHLSLLGGHYQLPFADIVFIEGQGNYTVFHSRDGQRILTSKSLSFYRDKLPAQLMRVHKSYFVNLLYVNAFDGEFVYLTSGQRLPVSRRRQEVKKQTLFQKI